MAVGSELPPGDIGCTKTHDIKDAEVDRLYGMPVYLSIPASWWEVEGCRRDYRRGHSAFAVGRE